MNDEPDESTEWLTGRIPLNISGVDVTVEVDVPAGAIHARRVLPVFQKLTNTIIDVAESQTEEKGKKISCKAGCGACCRQLVPIAEMETFHLRDLLEAMPDTRKTEIRARFTAALERLEKAGLLEAVRKADKLALEEKRALGNEYFKLQIACPFLVEESCSIHTDRPISCREYLVTSPPENCARPQDNIEGVYLPAKLSAVIFSLGSEPPAITFDWIPLILALEWAETHEEDSQEHTAPEWIDRVLNRLTEV
jgi:Fe-S-cluster containining protein